MVDRAAEVGWVSLMRVDLGEWRLVYLPWLWSFSYGREGSYYSKG